MAKAKRIADIFTKVTGISIYSKNRMAEFEIRRVEGAFEVHRTDTITNTTLDAWVFGILREKDTVQRRYALLKKLPGGGVATVGIYGSLEEVLNHINTILLTHGIIRGFSMEELARLS